MESIAIPDTIQGVIIARIDRLDEDVNHVLRTASVIGRAFLYRVLDAVLQVDGQLEQHLAALQAMELIHEKQLMPELEYIFKHALAQEATYESILHQTRRQLHFQVGQALEALFVNHLEEYYGLLAYHYAQADVRDSYCLSFYKYWNLLQDKILKHSLNRTGVGACSSFGIYPNDLSVKLQTDLSSCAQRFISCVARSLQGSKKYAKMPPSDFE
jgi:predicted ATPase